MANYFLDKYGEDQDEDEALGVQETDASIISEQAAPVEPEPVESPLKGNFFYDKYGQVEPMEVPVAEPEEEEASLMEQLVAGYKDLRARTKFGEAVAVGKREEDTSPAYEYAEGTLGERMQQEIGDPQEARIQKLLDESAAFRAEGEGVPLSKATMDFLDENSDKTIWEAFKDAPVQIVTELGARSGAGMVPGLVSGAALGTVAGPGGFAAGMGLGSARVDYAATIIEKVREAGVDITDAKALKAFVNTPEMKEIELDALKRSAVVGGVDAVAGLVGAKSFTSGIKNKLISELANVGIQMPVQAGLGALGEAGGQVVIGEELRPREIAAEAAGELVTAPVDVAAAAISGARGKVDEAEADADAGPLTDLEKSERDTEQLGRDINEIKQMGAAELETYQQEVRDDVASRGGDTLEQELAAAQAGVEAGGALDSEVASLTRLMAQRTAADEEARYFEDQVKEDVAREEIQTEAAERYEAGLKKVEADKQAAEERVVVAEKAKATLEGEQKAAVAKEVREAEVKKEAVVKTRAAEKATMQLRKLRKRRQELGLEPKTELEGVSPYPSPQEVEAFRGEKPKSAAMAQAFEAAAQEAATSPVNALPEPTEAQKSAGNYKKGHSRLAGLGITIENPAGSTRKGKGWSQKMQDHYGYIKGTSSAEGKTEQIDVFVGKDINSPNVFIVDQVNEAGAFDEHKVMMGYPNEFAARKAYQRNYPKGFKIGPISTVEMGNFKEWLNSGDQTVPYSGEKLTAAVPATPATAEQVEEVVQRKPRKGGRRGRILFRKGEESASQRLVQEIKDKEGFTVDNKTGQPVTTGFSVGQNLEEVIEGEVTPEQLDAFREKFSAELAEPGNVLGAWYNKADGKTYLDVSRVFESRQEALDMAAANKELAIFHLDTFTEIKTTPEGNEYFAEAALKDPHVQMSPDAFLTMAERLLFAVPQKEADLRTIIDTQGEKLSSLPLLIVKDGKVIGHEGRHRALELKSRGVTSIPVRVIGDRTKTLTSQDGKNEIPFPGKQEGRDLRDFFSDITKGLAGKSSTGKPYIPVISAVANKADSPGPTNKFASAYVQYRGNFDDHIAFSIPGFKEVQVAVGTALASVYGKGSNILDIGASEGSFVKAITSLSGAHTVALDPNPDMRDTFNKTPVEGSEYAMDALGSKEQEGQVAWQEDGVDINYYDPSDTKFDVVHEAMVFQFISPDRQGQISRVKELLKADGVAIFEEKMFTEAQEANEAKKNEYKRQYFEQAEMTKKAQEILEGMDENTVHQNTLEQVLTGEFKYVTQFWDSGNFKGYAVSDSPMALARVVSAIGDTQSEFSTTETPRRVKAPSEVRGSIKLRKVDNKKSKVDNNEALIAVAELNEKLPGMKTNVLRTAYDLPEALFNRVMEEFGMTGLSAKGMIDANTGEIYVFSENHENVNDVITTAMHEGVGHKGLRTLFNQEQKDAVMDSVYAGGPAVESAVNKIARSYNLDVKNAEERRLAVEEFIAATAEGNIDAPILQRVIDAIRQVLRNLGILDKWTDADIKALLRRTRSVLKKGVPLSKINLTSEVEIAETGEIVELSQVASVALRQMDKRIGVVEKLIGCVS